MNNRCRGYVALLLRHKYFVLTIPPVQNRDSADRITEAAYAFALSRCQALRTPCLTIVYERLDST